MAMTVRGGNNVRDAVLHAESRHGEAFVEGARAVIDSREDVAVNIEQV
jgi:hypothetical protein